MASSGMQIITFQDSFSFAFLEHFFFLHMGFAST